MIYTHQMNTIDQNQSDTSGDDSADFCGRLTDEQDQLALDVLGRVADKWSLWILHDLARQGGPLRFSQLHRQVEGISQKMLTQCLRRLEQDGLVTRTLYPQIPPRVDYELTPLGSGLLKQILPLWRWVAENVNAFETARARSGISSRAGHS